jgi:hypothetical protein
MNWVEGIIFTIAIAVVLGVIVNFIDKTILTEKKQIANKDNEDI